MAFDDETAYEVIVAVANLTDFSDVVVSRGVRLTSLHGAVAAVVGLPAGWRDTQAGWLATTLEPLRINGEIRLARLYATDERGDSVNADDLVATWLNDWGAERSAILYLRAEAGKGKSTLLANGIQQALEGGEGPLPIYVPLRTLQRGMGVAWSDVAAQLGVLGSAADNLRAAVRCGLVALALDGLDEVAGRYDPTIVQGVVSIVVSELQTEVSNVVLSGRTTEAGLLTAERATVFGIDLPEPDDPAFWDYTSLVVRLITPEWPRLAARIPEPPIAHGSFRDEAPEEYQIESIQEWIARVFADLGKDRSLFFVQSLACIGRSFQLDGNRPLVIVTGGTARIAEASLYDVCLLAAALACVREQDKIEALAQPFFGPAEQLELLTWMAVRASAGASARELLATPPELARQLLRLDPTHQYEEFTAALRQLQKHALLFAVAGDGARAGDWRPQFLSDWVRAALLCRAWERADLAPGTSRSDAEHAIVTAERSRLAFQYLFPGLLRAGKLARAEVLEEALCRNADAESPEAAANFWGLVAGLGPEGAAMVTRLPMSVPPMTDLSELTLDGLRLDARFGGTLFFLAGAEFSGCALDTCAFEACDFSSATFTGSHLSRVSFRFCDGPIVFDGCTFESCLFEDMRTGALPALVFHGCTFDDATRVVQHVEAGSGIGYGPAVTFEDCEGSADLAQVVGGEMIGLDPYRTSGYSIAGVTPDRPPAEQCLRALLKPFFPRRAGADAQLQARPYIRSSAIGRGRLPKGSPTADTLIDVLFSEGFTAGGREAHVYAPWSSVAGVGEGSVELRKELLSFLHDGRQGPTVKRLLERIDRAASW